VQMVAPVLLISEVVFVLAVLSLDCSSTVFFHFVVEEWTWVGAMSYCGRVMQWDSGLVVCLCRDGVSLLRRLYYVLAVYILVWYLL
jgi:hypothetical protein